MADNNNNFQSMMHRARWDRLLAALLVILVPIILICLLAKSCSKNKKPKPEENVNIIETAETTVPTTEAPKDYSKAIFLAPSTQEDDLYACDKSISEEQAMFDLAGRVQALLEADGYTVIVCENDDNVKKKVTKGNELGCAAYVALYSNSNQNEVGGEGTECYYNADIPGSQALAENVYNRVAELTPTDDRGLKDQEQRDLYEIMNNHYPCCLLEVEFHDNETGSQWILDNMDDTAKAVKDGIVAFLKNKEAKSAPAATDPAGEGSYDYDYGMRDAAGDA